MAFNSGSDRNPHLPSTQAQPDTSIGSHNSSTGKAPASPFLGWDSYPTTLLNNNTLSQNARVLSTNLNNDSMRLFSAPTDTSVEVLDVLETPDPNSPLIQRKANHVTFENILMDDRRFHFRRFSITPKNSWSKLPITEEMLRKLLTFYQVSPDFLRVIHFFGRQTRERISSSAGFRSLLQQRTTAPEAYVSEVCVRMVHVEKHGRVDPDVPDADPWSVRQIGCYQRFNYEDSSSICIHIQPPKDADACVEDVLKRGKFGKWSGQLSPISLQLAIVTTAMQNWQAYVESLEAELTQYRECVLLTDEDWRALRESGDVQTGYSDYRRLRRYFRDKLLNALSVFDLNLDVIQGLQRHKTKLLDLRLITRATYDDASDILERNCSIIKELQRDTRVLLDRADSAAQLIHALFEIRNDTLIRSHTLAASKLVEMAQHSSQSTASLVEMARDSKLDSELMVEFAERTKRDSRTMKIATMLATLYLPGTFCATIFSMGFFHSEPQIKGGKQVYTFSIAAQIWIFVVIVAALTAVTAGSFWLWDARLRREESHKVKEVTLRRDSIKISQSV